METEATPICFGATGQYENWKKAQRVSGFDASINRSGYCADCTPEYQATMLKANRCAYPKTTFRLDEDGMVEGVRAVDRIVSRIDAIGVVRDLLADVAEKKYALALFVLRGGQFRITPPVGADFDFIMKHSPSALVGIYNKQSKDGDIVADIWLRCAELGIEWSITQERSEGRVVRTSGSEGKKSLTQTDA